MLQMDKGWASLLAPISHYLVLYRLSDSFSREENLEIERKIKVDTKVKIPRPNIHKVRQSSI